MEHHLNMAKRLVKKNDCFPYLATLINNKFFLRQKDSFAKFQNIPKGTVDATLEYLLCGFVRHFKIKHVLCKNLFKNF